jgi:hypothetical protein
VVWQNPKIETPRSRSPRLFLKILQKPWFMKPSAGCNRNFEQALQDLERLATLDLFTDRWQRRAFKACRATMEETRAWTNFEVIEVIHQREEREWVRFARIRQKAEKQSTPDDVSPPRQQNAGKSLRRKRLA